MKNFLTKIWQWLDETLTFFWNFIISLILGKSPISIKKVLAFFFSFAAIYVGIFQNKPDIVMQFLGIVVLLLGLRSYDKTKYSTKVDMPQVGFKVGMQQDNEEEEKG